MKLLWVLENYHPKIGGVETLFKALEERLTAGGHELTIITTAGRRKLPEEEKLKGVRMVRIPFRSRYLFTILAIPVVWHHARSADLVQTTSYNAGFPAWIGAKMARKKVVITFHEVWGDLWHQLPFLSRFTAFLFQKFEKMLLRLSFDRFIAVSKSTAEQLAANGVPPEKIEVIYNGIHYADFEAVKGKSRSSDAAQVWTYFGRLGVSKGLDLLLPAFAQVQEEFPASKLQLIIPAQKSKVSNWILRFIREQGLEERVEIRHHLDFQELKSVISTSHCVVVPSYSEGFCFAAVEAIALGTPVVSSNRTALREVVGGRCVRMKGHSVADLAEAMAKAMRGEWEELPTVQFPLADTVTAYEQLYRELIAGETAL